MKNNLRCDLAEKQFEDFGEDAKFKKAEQMQSQDLETQEYTQIEDGNMLEKLNNSVVYACRSGRNVVAKLK